jgi:hypothetical protein
MNIFLREKRVCILVRVAMATNKTIIDFLLTKISNLLENSQFKQLCRMSTQRQTLTPASQHTEIDLSCPI